MNKKTITYLILFAIIGLIAGYFLFGKIGNEYVSLKSIFGLSSNSLESFGRKISGLSKIKQNILISGGVGAIAGLIISVFRKK